MALSEGEESHRRHLRNLAESLVRLKVCEQDQITYMPVSKRAGMMLVTCDPLIYVSERKGMLTVYREPDETLYYGDSVEAATFIRGWYAGAEQMRKK
jgi:hypothetical protein